MGQLRARSEEEHLPAQSLSVGPGSPIEVDLADAPLHLSRTAFAAMSQKSSIVFAGPLRCLAMLISSLLRSVSSFSDRSVSESESSNFMRSR